MQATQQFVPNFLGLCVEIIVWQHKKGKQKKKSAYGHAFTVNSALDCFFTSFNNKLIN